ncbi:MAG: BMP family ABC transporter substrate-binding protein [Bacillota bacterium]
MKKNYALVIILICSLLSGCGMVNSGKTEKAKIGLILNFGGPNDSARNQSADGGLHEVARDFGSAVETKMFETAADGSNEEYLIRLLAANDYKIVFLFDNDLGDRLAQIAAVYPNTRFVRLDSSYKSALGNLQEADYDIQAAGSAAGMLAGMASKTGAIGFIDFSAKSNESVFEQSFFQGIRKVSRTGELVALTKDKLAALQKSASVKTINPVTQPPVNGKIDIIFANGMYAEQLDLINSCKSLPLKIITCGANPLEKLTAEQQRLVIATFYKNTGATLYSVVKQQLAGKFQSGVVRYGLASGMDVLLNDKADGLTDVQKTLYKKLLKDIETNQLGEANK